MKKLTIEERKEICDSNLEWYKSVVGDHIRAVIERQKKINELTIKSNELGKELGFTPEELIPVDDYNEKYKSSIESYKETYKDKQYLSEPSYKGVDVSKYLDEIRNEDYEISLTIAIKDGNVVEIDKSKGFSRFGNGPLESKAAKRMIKEAKEKGYIMILAHNHPRVVSAKPSRADYTCHAALNRKELNSVDGDWFVVTPYDTFSFKQNKKAE